MECVGMNKVIGITGSMAAGKSTLVNKLKEIYPEYIYIDVDDFRRNLFKNQSYINDLKKVIPELRQYDNINSIILNKYIYENENYMQNYKEVLYRYLFNYIDSFEDKTIVVEWALILNDKLEKHFDKIIFVDAQEKIRLSRLKESDLSIEDIKKRFKLQELDLNKYQNIYIAENNDKLDIGKICDYLNRMECKFTLPKDGGKVIWEITHQCNYNCSYCIFSCNQKIVPNELTTLECLHVIDELVKNDFKHLKVTGGEPFLRKDIIDILKYASKYLITDISTNASLLTQEKVELLNQIKLKMIHVSLDGLKESHESVRGVNTYDRTMRGLEYLRNSRNKVRIGCVIHKNNEYDLKKITESVISTSADEIIYSIMEPPASSSKELVKTKSISTLIKELEELKKEYQNNITVNYNFASQPSYVTTCPAGNLFLYVDNLGRISPCPWVHEVNPNCISSLSLRDNSLQEILQDNEIKKFLSLKKCGKCYGQIQ